MKARAAYRQGRRAVLGTVLAAALLAGPAAALPPLSQERHINESLVQARVADMLRRGCPSLDARIIRAFGEARKLKRYALDQGYSEAQIDAFLDSRDERRRIYALQVRGQRLVQIAGDLAVFAPPRLAHLADARDLGGKAHAAGAGNAACHVGFDQRTKVQLLGGALWLSIPAEVHAVSHCLILQIAFAALVADRAIQRMVDKQELHHPFAGLLDHRRVGADFRRRAIRTGAQILDLHRAGCGRLGRAAHDLDQAHPAIAGDRQPLVIAEARNLDPGQFAGLDQGQVGVDRDFGSVDLDRAQIGHRFFLTWRPEAIRRSSSVQSLAAPNGRMSRAVR
jgi:hypothetical protein